MVLYYKLNIKFYMRFKFYMRLEGETMYSPPTHIHFIIPVWETLTFPLLACWLIL